MSHTLSTQSCNTQDAPAHALMLNNAGITLLERGYYKQAISTLKDAVHVMKSICDHRNLNSRDAESAHETPQLQEPAYLLEVEAKVKKALKRISKSSQYRKKTVKSRGEFDTVFYEDNNISLQALDLPDITGDLRCARIDLPDLSLEARDTDLETVVVLSNFGLSYYLCSRSLTAKDKDASDKLLKQTNAIFDLASDVITNRLSSCEDDFDEARILSVALLLTGNLSRINMETGRVDDARTYYSKYHTMLDKLRSGDVAKWFFDTQRIVAASAA